MFCWCSFLFFFQRPQWFCLLPCSSSKNSTISWPLQLGLLLTFSSLSRSSFFLSAFSYRLLISLSSMHSWNILNCSCPIFLFLLKILVWLSLPWRPVCQHESSSRFLKFISVSSSGTSWIAYVLSVCSFHRYWGDRSLLRRILCKHESSSVFLKKLFSSSWSNSP